MISLEKHLALFPMSLGRNVPPRVWDDLSVTANFIAFVGLPGGRDFCTKSSARVRKNMAFPSLAA